MVFDPTVSQFRRANDPEHPTEVSLSALAERIRSDDLAARCAEIRRVFDAADGGQAGKDAIRELKKPLPGVTLAGTFARRANAAWQTPSGCVGIDLDDLAPAELERAWTSLAAAPWVALLFRSPSGAGIKGAVRVPGLDTPDLDAYATAWRAVTLWLASLGLDNDQAVKDVSRLAFLAHDPEVHWNPDAVAFDLDQWQVAEPIDPQPERDEPAGLRPGDDFNQRGDLAGLLIHHGWTLDRDGANQHWCRPGKSGGTPATLKDGIFYVFTSAAPPFEPNHAYRAFAVYALLEHGGDYTAASAELRRCGYGAQKQAVDVSALMGGAAESDDEPAEPEPDDPGPIPVELLRCPGFIDEVIGFTLATAPYPEPTLAFCGAVALQALLASRKVCDAADNRSTLYLLGLANSGSGKDHPRKVNQHILHAVGLSGQMGDSFASAEGIEDRMLVSPAMLFQTDEMDALLVSIKEGKDGRSERMMQTLLKFYSAANALYHMRVKAGKEPETIDQPALSIFGTAIPQHFYESLSAKMLSNGFFARMLVLEAGKRGTGQDASRIEPTESILATARWWAEFCPGTGGNLTQMHPKPQIVPATSGAQECLRSVRNQADASYAEHEARGDQMGMALWARAAEKVRRLALIHACSANHQDPMITEAGVTWAWQLVEHQTRRMVAMAKLHVYEGEFDQKQKKAIQAIRAKGGSLSQRQMTKVLRNLPPREREDVLGNLLETGQIVLVTEQTGGRPRTCYRLPDLVHKSEGGSNVPA